MFCLLLLFYTTFQVSAVGVPDLEPVAVSQTLHWVLGRAERSHAEPDIVPAAGEERIRTLLVY